MAYQTTDAQQEFDRWSGRYDRDLLQLCFFRPAHHMLLANLTTRHRRVLDIGCGTGKFAERVLHRFPGTQVWGLDLSAGMLRQCQLRHQSAGGRMHLVRGDSERLPFEDNAFDAITCTHSFHHYPHQQKVLGEMHRVLRPGGKLLIIDGDRDGLWGQLLFDVFVVMVEGPVTHLTGRAFRRLYTAAGFGHIMQQRRGGPLPFLLTVGEAVKQFQVTRRHRAA
ncbi:MAG TPA: class I SAM-dependent methyltransferase [Gemmataceae bacterium]|nr:class I SAM-dependent methyltransferase [Gemmataceae bacterium]